MVRYNKSRVDHIFESWLNNQNKQRDTVGKKIRPTITISGKCGTEGHQLAEKLCLLLQEKTKEDWKIYEQELIKDVSSQHGICEQFLRDVGIQAQFFDIFSFSSSDQLSQSEAFMALVKQIAKVARKGNVILIGRGAEIVTKDFHNCLHYRLESPMEYRINTISETLNLSIKEANKFIKERQERRERFIENYFSCKLGDSVHYHAIYNTSKKDLNRIALNIREAVIDKINVFNIND